MDKETVMQVVVDKVGEQISWAIEFARKHEIICWAIVIMFVKNRRKRPLGVHLGIVGLAMFLLRLLFGTKELTHRLKVSRQTIWMWCKYAGIADFDEIEKIDREGIWTEEIVGVEDEN